jgi:hypothetical protein
MSPTTNLQRSVPDTGERTRLTDPATTVLALHRLEAAKSIVRESDPFTRVVAFARQLGIKRAGGDLPKEVLQTSCELLSRWTREEYIAAMERGDLARVSDAARTLSRLEKTASKTRMMPWYQRVFTRLFLSETASRQPRVASSNFEQSRHEGSAETREMAEQAAGSQMPQSERGTDDTSGLHTLPGRKLEYIAAGHFRYRLRTPVDFPIFQHRRIELAGFVATGPTLKLCLESVGWQVHRRYHQLKAKGAHARTDVEEREWKHLWECFDLDEFEAKQPMVTRELAKVESVHANVVRARFRFLEQEVLEVELDALPAGAVATLVPGQWFVATLKRTGDRVDWLDVERTEAPPDQTTIVDRFLTATEGVT